MHPLWFGRKHGYQGTTWNDAVEFCKNVGGMSVCPLEGEHVLVLLFLLKVLSLVTGTKSIALVPFCSLLSQWARREEPPTIVP
jgi:hypothetical protein